MNANQLFGIVEMGDTLIVYPTFAPKSLETAKSVIVRGDCSIKGGAACAILRGAEMSMPAVVVAPLLAAASVVIGAEVWMLSPIAGMIYSIELMECLSRV